MPSEITVQELFGLFMKTLSHYDESHVLLSNEDLSAIILDELDIDATSFLHEWTINRLINYKLIPADMAKDVNELRSKTLALIDDKHTTHEIRNDQEWQSLRLLANEIRMKLINS